MFEGAEFRKTERGWEWNGQVLATDDDRLRPAVALLVALAGRKIRTWERDGDVVRVTSVRRRPCRRGR